MAKLGIAGPAHYYVYRLSQGRYLYERTCGTERAAQDRVDELNHRAASEYRPQEGPAVWLLNHLIRGAFY